MRNAKPNSQQQLLVQAAEWLVLLSSDQANPQTQRDYQAWCAQSAAHQAAAMRMQGMVDKLKDLKNSAPQQASTQIIEQALSEPVQFKFVPKLPILVTVFCTLLLVGLIYTLLPSQYWLADRRSSYDTWRSDRLADQSLIDISGHSAYNIDFDAKQRRLELIDGNIWVDVAKDAKRPFIIETEFAQIQALGTRFIVHQSEDYTILSMLHSKVRLTIGAVHLDVSAGQQVVVDRKGIYAVQQIDPVVVEQAWAKRQLAVENMPLDQVLSILDSYQQGYAFYSQTQMASLKVTAILPLDRDADRSYLLSQSLPIAIHQPVPWLRYMTKQKAD